MNEKGFANIVLIIAVIVLISVAGYFGFVRKSKPVAEEFRAPSGEMANWKTYRNKVYGLEIKHPVDWTVIKENNDMSLQNTLERFGGDRAEVVTLDEKSGSNVTVIYLGTNLNFSDCDGGMSQEECLKLRETNKMSLDQFMAIAGRTESFQNVKKTLLNSYNAYEIDFQARVSEDGGKTYREENRFFIMVEDKEGGVFRIDFNDRPTKNDLSSTELQMLSTFKFIQ
jgi:hypothetical protein